MVIGLVGRSGKGGGGALSYFYSKYKQIIQLYQTRNGLEVWVLYACCSREEDSVIIDVFKDINFVACMQ